MDTDVDGKDSAAPDEALDSSGVDALSAASGHTVEDLQRVLGLMHKKLKQREAKMKKMAKQQAQSAELETEMKSYQDKILSLTKERDHAQALCEEMKFKLQNSLNEQKAKKAIKAEKRAARMSLMLAAPSTIAEDDEEEAETVQSSSSPAPAASLSVPGRSRTSSLAKPGGGGRAPRPSIAMIKRQGQLSGSGSAASAFRAMSKLQENSSQMEKQLEAERKKHKELYEKLRAQERAVNAAKTTMAESKEQVTREKEAHKETREKLQQLQGQLSSLETESKLLTNRLTASESGHAQAKEDLKALESKLQSATVAHEAAATAAASKLLMCEKELEEEKSLHVKEKKAKESVEKKNSELNAEVERLAQSLKRLEEDKTGVEKTLDEKLVTLSQQKKEVEEQLATKKATVAQQEGEISRLLEVERENTLRGERIQVLEGLVAEQKDKIAALETAKKDLGEQLQKLTADHNTLTQAKQQVDNEKSILEETLSKKQSDLASLQQTHIELEKHHSDLKHDYEAKNKLQEETAHKLSEVEELEAKCRETLKDTKLALEKEKEDHKVTLDNLEVMQAAETARKNAELEMNKPVQCQQCQVWTTNQWLEDHMKEVCQKRLRECFLGCGAKFPSQELSGHLKHCPKYTRKEFEIPEGGIDNEIIKKHSVPSKEMKSALFSAASAAAGAALGGGLKKSGGGGAGATSKIQEGEEEEEEEAKVDIQALQEREKEDREALDAWEKEFNASLLSEDDEEEDEESDDDGDPLAGIRVPAGHRPDNAPKFEPKPPPKPPKTPKPPPKK
eukprot:g15081.t1